jgi:hypothetical protein
MQNVTQYFRQVEDSKKFEPAKTAPFGVYFPGVKLITRRPDPVSVCLRQYKKQRKNNAAAAKRQTQAIKTFPPERTMVVAV